MLNAADPAEYLDTAISALKSGDARQVLDEIPVPIYTTDENGAVTYWNRACVAFRGREPEGNENWCVSWQLFTMDGEPLPHDQCPMAIAVKEKRAIRGELAIAGRPDGSRIAFSPYPTPLFDESGALTGAVNMLIDISEEQAGALREQADRCRRLSRATHDRNAADMLKTMADGYDDSANAMRPAS